MLSSPYSVPAPGAPSELEGDRKMDLADFTRC